MLLSVGVTAAVAAAPAKKLTDLQKGLAFYRGATITMISPGTAGGGFDLTCRAIAQYMAQYLHATVNVVDMGQASGTPGMDSIAHAAANGLTFGELNLLNVAGQMLINQPTLNFNPAREEYIAGVGPTAYVMVASGSSPYTSFAALKAASPAPKTLVDVPGTSNTLVRILNGVLGVPANYVAGYTSASAVVTGFVRGDGPVTFQGLSSLGSLVPSGVARPLLVGVKVPVGTIYRQYVLNVPTVADILKQYPAKTKKQATAYAVLENFIQLGNPIVTQTSVAAYKLDALRAAAAWSFQQPGFKTLILAAGSNPEYVNPVAAKAQLLLILKEGTGVACYISGAC